MKKFQILAAVAACGFWAACSNGTSNPGSADGDVSSVEKTDGATAQFAKQSGSDDVEPVEDVADVPAVANTDDGEDVAEPESSSSEPESSVSLDSMLSVLFPDGIDVDTARHDPDSVGVWHFYDPRGTHDNPNFAYGEMTDPRDGIVYKTTTIGGQVWMAENLNYFDIEGAPSSIKNDWCYWDKPENCESAGRLYTWTVAQRICPEGWHLPTNEDWAALLVAVEADSVNEILWKGASKLKAISGWENDGSGTDDFGFTALPAGKKFFTKVQDGFTGHGCSALMWASTEAEGGAADSLAFRMELDCSNDNVIINTAKKYDGLSVRCIKD
ncbi:MAG: fibrobacter succinogenes major paralogous domain-containing protein [Fibrobacter sp.]|nr:fibrobacter succinogenes major paralogous domain-containing protein [Fibrobacter sp.]